MNSEVFSTYLEKSELFWQGGGELNLGIGGFNDLAACINLHLVKKVIFPPVKLAVKCRLGKTKANRIQPSNLHMSVALFFTYLYS